ncbi:hypothetical protein SNEBB_008838 [Seison nebaliae]|nr:hypothetical protein SNEBB_008838 [Seison nebaliae]
MFLLIFLSILSFSPIHGEVYQQPTQIHLALTNQDDEMSVTWNTITPVNDSMIQFGLSLDEPLPFNINQVRREVFIDGGAKKRLQFVYFGIMKPLKLGQRYFYRVGSPTGGWSAVYYFIHRRFAAGQEIHSSDLPLRLAVFGDMGNVNAQSLPRLQTEVLANHFDAILHVGDFAYDMASDDGLVGDAFMDQIETIASYLPYMTTVGNHENHYNFSNYVNRFHMPGRFGTFNNDDNLFYSIDIGPIHLIGFSTEFYFYVQYGWEQIARQYKWLENDLIEANKNRKNVPWIITMGHRPMYCSDRNGDDCTKVHSITREGLPVIHAYGLEELFYKYGVDVELYAHEHNYERLWPIYNFTNLNGSYANPYTDFRGPVHIITGSAGCQEKHNDFKDDKPSWSAFRALDYGYSRVTVHNDTHIYVDYVSDDKKGQVIDQFWIVKHNHGPYK